jgi:hypothetical protein
MKIMTDLILKYFTFIHGLCTCILYANERVKEYLHELHDFGFGTPNQTSITWRKLFLRH